jgi:hypothetical protein
MVNRISKRVATQDQNQVKKSKTEEPYFTQILPKDILLYIFSFLKNNLKNTRLVGKKFLQLSDEALINFINKKKISLKYLGSPLERKRILKKYGHQLHYFKDKHRAVIYYMQHCPNVKELILTSKITANWRPFRNTLIEEEHYGHVFRSQEFTQLETLCILAEDHFGKESFQALTNLQLTKLKKLTLRCGNYCTVSYISDNLTDFSQFLAKSSNLEELDVADNNLTDESVQILSSTQLPKLRKLDISNNRVSPICIQYITSASWFSQLVGLNNPRISHPSLFPNTPITTIPSSNSLEELQLSANQLNDKHIHQLSKSQLPKLLRLSIHDNPFTKEGLKTLTNAPWFHQLKGLGLGDHAFDNDKVIEMLIPSQVSNLDYLNLIGSKITLDAVKKLTKSKVFTKLEYLVLLVEDVASKPPVFPKENFPKLKSLRYYVPLQEYPFIKELT